MYEFVSSHPSHLFFLQNVLIKNNRRFAYNQAQIIVDNILHQIYTAHYLLLNNNLAQYDNLIFPGYLDRLFVFGIL